MINLFGLYFNFWVLLLLVILGVVSLLVWRWVQTYSPKKLYFSNIADFQSKSGLPYLPELLFLLSLAAFGLAALDPHTFTQNDTDSKPPTPTEGVGIYLVLDKSGSMAEKVTSPGQREEISKVELMKKVTAKFVQERPSDLIGLVTFARQADVLVPLTLDHTSVNEALAEIAQVPDKNMDGTAIGYAIYKTVSVIDATRTFNQDKKKNRSAYEIKNNVIVLVTDGLQDPNPLDQGNRLRTIGLDEAAQYAAEKGVKLYIINVEPQIATERYSAQRKQLERITQQTGGRFYIVDGGKELEKVYGDINQLEKSLLPNVSKEMLPQYYQRQSFYPWLIALGLAFFLAAVIAQTIIFRRVP